MQSNQDLRFYKEYTEDSNAAKLLFGNFRTKKNDSLKLKKIIYLWELLNEF